MASRESWRSAEQYPYGIELKERVREESSLRSSSLSLYVLCCVPRGRYKLMVRNENLLRRYESGNE